MDYSNSQYYHKPGGPSSSAYQAYPNIPPHDHTSAGPGNPQWPPHPQHIQAIPAPQPKTAYEPPVFSTFQDRKRAKELARRQGSGEDVTRTQSPAQFNSVPEPPTTVPTRRPRPQPVPPIVPASPSRTPSPIQAVIERSDTISSIRSLDRVGFPSGRRPLPKPPVGVNSSRSLDRGVAPRPLNTSQRRQPSTVEEETLTPSPTTPYPSIVEPSSSRSLSPAKFNQLPVINFPDEDGDGDEIEVKEPTGIAVSLVPIIQVSQDTAREQTGALLCKGCNEPIIGRFVNAMGQRWHPHCFKCNTCGDMLEHVSSYEAGGKAYCHLDYHNEFANQCFHCKTPIVDARFVTLDDPMLGQRFYHELHFFCSECGDPFLDPSKSSAPGAGGTDDGETDPFVIHKGHPYCEKCHLRLHKPRCKKCTLPIPDVAVAAMGAKWHRECFVCASCGRDFPNGMFFPKDGLALCTECWEQSA